MGGFWAWESLWVEWPFLDMGQDELPDSPRNWVGSRAWFWPMSCETVKHRFRGRAFNCRCQDRQSSLCPLAQDWQHSGWGLLSLGFLSNYDEHQPLLTPTRNRA